MVKRWHVDGYVIPGDRQFGRRLGAKSWIELWNQSSTAREKKSLIQIASDVRDPRIEDILIGGLENPELAGHCAQSLAFMGSQRACPAIRNLLAMERDSTRYKSWHREMAFRALATLRDPSSVPPIVRYLESEESADKYDGAVGLASIGTEDAELALLGLKNQSDEVLVRGLVHFGSRTCVERAIEIAKRRDVNNGAAWLAERCQFSFWGFHGRSSQQYRTDVDIAPFLDFVLAQEPNEEICERLATILDAIDVPAVRELLREWYDLRDTPEDMALTSSGNRKLSDIAFRELTNRGDDHVLAAHVEREIERYRDYEIHSWAIEQLAVFDRQKVRSTLRTKLQDDCDTKSRRVIVDLIGHVGDESDIGELQRLIESESDLVANAAFEAKLRLTDPLRLAEHW